jgi:hypothetical protein
MASAVGADMAPKIPAELTATERASFADVRPQPVKAELRQQPPATPIWEVAAMALERVKPQKEAAADIGIHRGRLCHKLKDGSLTLKQLQALGPVYGRAFGEACCEVYGAETPEARRARLIRSIQSSIDELAKVG